MNQQQAETPIWAALMASLVVHLVAGWAVASVKKRRVLGPRTFFWTAVWWGLESYAMKANRNAPARG